MNKVGAIGASEPSSLGRSPHSVAANAGWSVVFVLWTTLLSLLLTPWMIRAFGADRYGILLLISSVTGILGVMNFGLGDAVLRFVAFYNARRNIDAINRAIGSTLAAYLLISLAVSAGLILLGPRIARLFAVSEGDRALVSTLVQLSAPVFTFGMVARTLATVPPALQRYDIATKVNVVQSVVRLGGYLVVLLLDLSILLIVVWDSVTLLLAVVAHAVIARTLLPGLRLRPRLSAPALRELGGYSVYSFLTFIFYSLHRHSAKLLVGRFLGPTGVTLVGVPDNLAERMHELVHRAGETLLPRFSAGQHGSDRVTLFWDSTWLATCVAVAIFVPLTVLLPDILRLWVGAEFAARGALVGQLIAGSYVAQCVFVPAMSLARGEGRPGIVTSVVFASGVLMLVGCLMLIPVFGVTGVGLAYLAGSIPSLAGTFYIASRVGAGTAGQGTFTSVLGPLSVGAATLWATSLTRAWIGPSSWVGVMLLAGASAGVTVCVMLIVESVFRGQHSRTRVLLQWVRRKGSEVNNKGGRELWQRSL